MKKFKFIFFLILFFFIIYFLFTIDILNFIKIYYVQLILILIAYFILNIFIIRGRYFILILTLIFFIFYFYIYPNYIEKRVLYSETFKEKSKIELLNVNLNIENGVLKLVGDKIDEDFIFDYSSFKKIYLFKKISIDNAIYSLIQNKILKKDINNSNEYNLIFNETKKLNFSVQGKSLYYDFDFSNILLNEFLLNSNSSFIDVKLPQNSNNLLIKLNLKPSFIKIGLRKNFYIEVILNEKNSMCNLEDLGFKLKNNKEYYFDGGENKIYIEINTYSSYLDFYFLD